MPATNAIPLVPALSPLDDPRVWQRSQAFEAPLSPEQVENVQKDIDAICGTTRDNKSIIKLVWNGDVRFWKELHDTWDSQGQPVGDTYKRPQVLHKSVYDDNDIWQFDAFPPRWLLLTRIEPEQYASTWRRESLFFHPDLKKFVQLLPSEVPSERYVWYMTIATHAFGCCQRAAAEDRNCVGRYVHPRHCLEELRRARRSLEEAGQWESHPFDSPADIGTRREREVGNHNYIESSLKKFRESRAQAIDMAPLATATATEFIRTPEIAALRKQLIERSKRDEENLAKRLEKRRFK